MEGRVSPAGVQGFFPELSHFLTVPSFPTVRLESLLRPHQPAHSATLALQQVLLWEHFIPAIPDPGNLAETLCAPAFLGPLDVQ